MLKIERAKFLGDVVGTLTFSIAVPTLKRFTANKLYPYFPEKYGYNRIFLENGTCGDTEKIEKLVL